MKVLLPTQNRVVKKGRNIMSANYHITLSAVEIITVRGLLNEFPEFKESYPEFYSASQRVKSKEICLDFVYWKMLFSLIDSYYSFLCDSLNSCDKGIISNDLRKDILDSMLIISDIADKISAAIE